jgi:galactokinase
MKWQRGKMNVDALTTVIAAVGAVMAALFGIYRASGGQMKPEQTQPTSLPAMVDQYLNRLKDIEEDVQAAVNVMHETKRVMETMSSYQSRSVGELEGLSRMMSRIENNQSNLYRTLEGIKSHEEVTVQILAQIREFVKGMATKGTI